MPKKLKADSIRAELTSIDKLLKESEEYDDFVAVTQFKYRQDELQKQLQQLDLEDENIASLALYFSGKPVYGSKGIDADFAGKALDSFQEMISKIFAIDETGGQAKKGKVAFKKHSKLAVTEVSKGSFGFILNEITEQSNLVKTELKHVVESLTTILDKTVSQNDHEFDEIVEKLDRRTLLSINKFFRNLDTHEATLRMVEGNSEHNFNNALIKLGRARIESTKIEEHNTTMTGRLTGFLPESRKFEFTRNDTVIKGNASADAVKSFEYIFLNGQSFDTEISAKFEIREIQRFGSETKTVYRLIDFSKVEPSLLS